MIDDILPKRMPDMMRIDGEIFVRVRGDYVYKVETVRKRLQQALRECDGLLADIFTGSGADTPKHGGGETPKHGGI
ncbi:MAG: hypothetical protein LUI09_01480 [Prevotellaceae bacterium]|nr:hypothetical protein [Prevotellaceae bacterium]